jgi:hypothetical protein
MGTDHRPLWLRDYRVPVSSCPSLAFGCGGAGAGAGAAGAAALLAVPAANPPVSLSSIGTAVRSPHADSPFTALLLSPCDPHVPRDSAQCPPLPAARWLLPRRPVRAACSTHVALRRHPPSTRPPDECSSHDFVLRPPQVGQCQCSLAWPAMAPTDCAVGPDEPCSWHHACQEGSQCAGTDTAREAPSQRWPSAERWQRQVLRLRKCECATRLRFSCPLC